MIHNAYRAREQSRWLRHDAALWVRPDAARFLAPGADVLAAFPALDRKYNPDQPRVPGGSGRESGRWTDGDVSPGDEEADDLVQLAQIDKSIMDADGLPYYARGGHHEMPKGVYEKWDLQPETRSVFNGSTTGSLPGRNFEVSEGSVRSHYWDDAHRGYNEAVREMSERFLEERSITPEKMTPEQARELLAEIRNSEDPRIRDYNRGIRILRRAFRFFRGRE